MIDFEITSDDLFSKKIKGKGIRTFLETCEFVSKLKYDRISKKDQFDLIIDELKGTCSSKHAFLAGIVDENKVNGIDLMVGIYFINQETHPEFTNFLDGKPYPYLPDAHCYFRVNGERYDYTFPTSYIDDKQLIFVREQRIEPNQVDIWKEAIHQDFIKKWLTRNPQFETTFEVIWDDREALIKEMTAK